MQKQQQQHKSVIPTSRKKKCVAVDQYLSRKLLREIPAQLPRKGERISQPDELPTLVRTAGNGFYCELCDAKATSFTQVQEHRVGRRHRKHVIIRAINENRFYLFSALHVEFLYF